MKKKPNIATAPTKPSETKQADYKPIEGPEVPPTVMPAEKWEQADPQSAMAILAKSPVNPDFVSPIWLKEQQKGLPGATELTSDIVKMLCMTVAHLRDIRDKKTFTMAGAHSFREWCVVKFGERLGCWLDEVL